MILTVVGSVEEGGPSFILEFSTGVQSNLGHDNAQSYFVYISPSTIWISAKCDIYGKLRSRRTQRRRLQGVWMRTRRGRQVLPENQLFRLDKRYYCLPIPAEPSLAFLYIRQEFP